MPTTVVQRVLAFDSSVPDATGLLSEALDADQDNVPDNCDSCPDTYNPGQEDVDGDDVGDACQGSPAVDLYEQGMTAGCEAGGGSWVGDACIEADISSNDQSICTAARGAWENGACLCSDIRGPQTAVCVSAGGTWENGECTSGVLAAKQATCTAAGDVTRSFT